MRFKAVFLVSTIVLISLLTSSVVFGAQLERDIQKHFAQIRVLVQKAVAGLDNATSVVAELEQLSSLVDDLQVSQLLLQERFRDRDDMLATAGGRFSQRQAAVEGNYRRGLAKLLSLFGSLPLAERLQAADLRPLLDLLNHLLPKKDLPILGSLPYKHLDLSTRQPVTEPIIKPAYLGGNSPVSAVDTQPSPLAPLSPEISHLAESLGWNPARIYQWVQQNIKTEWYWGAMKGATETLRQKSGNDADQAALLVALLRAANFPTRYVRGVIEFFPGLDKLRNLTSLQDPLKIAAFLQKAGIPFRPLIQGGRIVNFQVEHIWVETFVPYANYRGAIIDGHGKIWLALDTHISPAGYDWNTPLDLPAAVDMAAQRDHFLAADQNELPLDFLQSQLEPVAGQGYQSLMRQRTRLDEPLNILPASLQFRQIAVTGEFAAFPEDLLHQVEFSATTITGAELFSLRLPLARLGNHQLVLDFEAETIADQQLIDSFGGLDNTPAYLVRLRPVLTLDGERQVVARDGLPMGQDYRLTVRFVAPSGGDQVTATHLVGNLVALSIVAQQALLPLDIPLTEKSAADLLYTAAQQYQQRWQTAEIELAELNRLALLRPLPSLVAVGGMIDVGWLLDTPQDFNWQGVFIDAGLRRVEVVAEAGAEAAEVNFMQLSALQGSALESRILEESFEVAAISTSDLLVEANRSGGNLAVLDADSLDGWLPLLSLADNIKADIVNAVHQGLRVTIPESEIVSHDWSGIGYLKENPATGEAGYMLSGMLAGGSTAQLEWTNAYLENRLQSPFADQANVDPLAAVHIARIRAGDSARGIVGQPHTEELAVLVTDIKGRPVAGAEVTFSSLAGGGSFAGSESPTVMTDFNGIARVRPLLGTTTNDNPTFLRLDTDDVHTTQVGVNLFTAEVASRYGALVLPQPFTAYALPDKPLNIVPLLGNGNSGTVNGPAGSILVRIVDRYGNPVSNQPVLFKALAAQTKDTLNPLPTSYRNIEFYRAGDCTSDFPLYAECSSSAEMTVESSPYGAMVDTLLGNTLNTAYAVEVSIPDPDVPAVVLSLSSRGQMRAGDYLAPQLLINYLEPVNDRGEPINATRVGTQMEAPLTAALLLISNGYQMEGPSTCTKEDSAGNPVTYDCWSIQGESLIETKKVTDGTVDFVAQAGAGTVTATENQGDGRYSTLFAAGSQPALNLIKASGKVTLSVPEVWADPQGQGRAIHSGYPDALLKMRSITLKSGQRALFNPATKNLSGGSASTAEYQVYGVDVPTSVAPQVIMLGDQNRTRDKVQIDYHVQPDAAGAAGYNANDVQIDLLVQDAAGNESWGGYLSGDATRGAGSGQFVSGSPFDPQKKYFAQLVLNRGSAVEIRGDKIPLNTLLVDLDIDSDNNAGWKPNGTHNDPSRNPLEDQAEDLAGLPGKVIQPNLRDGDGDKVPGFADGINLYDQAGEGASAPFVPLLLEVGGSFDPAMIKLQFSYSASNPAQLTRSGNETDGYSYQPAPGNLRIWSKDGPQSRNIATIKNGGDYLSPDESYSLAELGQVNGGIIKLYVEGIATGTAIGDQRIELTIDPDGSGALTTLTGDVVNSTVLFAALVPDYNHDRVIDDTDRQRAALGDTFYFWINDDDDQGETTGSDIPGSTFAWADNSDEGLGVSFNDVHNYETEMVDGVRDLVDFFPVQLDLKDLLALYPATRYDYRLTTGGEQLNLAYTPLKADRAGDYLTNLPVAKTLGHVSTFPLTSAGTSLKSSATGEGFVQKLTAGESDIILLEGRSAFKGPLRLEISDGTNTLFRSELNLSLSGVENMFRHVNLIDVATQKDNPPEHGTKWGEPDRFEIPVNCPEDACLNTDGTNFVFVHGYNVNGQQARGWQSEMFKRLFWSGSKAKFWGVTWYGADSQWFDAVTVNYQINVQHALKTAAGLRQFLNAQMQGPTSIAAHSLGNMLVSASLNDPMDESLTAPISNFFMIDAAVPIEAFTDSIIPQGFDSTNKMVHPDWYGYKPILAASEWYRLFVDDTIGGDPDARGTLTWRSRFGGLPSTVKYYNFYSSGEEVLAVHSGIPSLEQAAEGPGRYTWALQEKLKGLMPIGYVLSSRYGGWGFNWADYSEIIDPGSEFSEETIWPPDKTNAITEAELKTTPFFKGGSEFEDLFSLQGPGNAKVEEKRNKWLVEAFPALTEAAGGPEGDILETEEFVDSGNAIDMQTEYTNGWPQERIDNEEEGWRHSDLKNVSYLYLYKIFDKMKVVSEASQ